MIASLRLGAPDKLSKEYYKVNGKHVWKGRILWMLFGSVGGSALGITFSGLAAIAGTTAVFFGLSGTAGSMVSFVATVICWTVLFSMLWRSGRRDQAVTNNGAASIRWLAVIIALMVFGHGLKIVGTSMHARTVGVKEFGESIYWASIGGLAIHVVVVMACSGMIVALGRSRDEENEIAS